jgi:two-component system, OmpR family, sensor histidine kinase SenX3
VPLIGYRRHVEVVWAVLITLVVSVSGTAVVIVTYSKRRRELLRTLRLSREDLPPDFALLLRKIDAPIIVVDPTTRVLVASQQAVNLGLVKNDWLVHSELMDQALRLDFHEDKSIEAELEVTRYPGGESILPLHVIATRLRRRFVLLEISDLTESRRIDEVRRDFVANVSHELKTPIGAVTLLAEALEMASEDPVQVKRFAKRLTGEAARLAGITSELIALSRLQIEDYATNGKPIAIDQVVIEAIDQNHVSAETKQIEIISGGDKGISVIGSKRNLTMAVSNLLSNAIRYSNEGSRIGVGITARQGSVEVSVTDQGIGMSQEDSARAFERFYRSDEARSRAEGGTGLGLSIVKHAAQSHGGDVRVWSQLGNGSTFTIRLPIASNPQIDKAK